MLHQQPTSQTEVARCDARVQSPEGSIPHGQQPPVMCTLCSASYITAQTAGHGSVREAPSTGADRTVAARILPAKPESVACMWALCCTSCCLRELNAA